MGELASPYVRSDVEEAIPMCVVCKAVGAVQVHCCEMQVLFHFLALLPHYCSHN